MSMNGTARRDNHLARIARTPAAALVLGALAALLGSVLLFSQFSINDRLSRDESIYVYGGQQLAAGIPPYASIVDPKTPLATMIAGSAVIIGRAADVDDVRAIRFMYFVLACLSVIAVFLAGALLFDSVAAGLLGAACFAAFRGFAMDALGGPNAKTAAVLLAVLATALLVRRMWFWAGMAASLATLVWQPLAIYALVAIGVAGVSVDRSARLRAIGAVLAGAALPVLATVAYFVASGAVAELVENGILLPLTGTERRDRTFPEHLVHVIEMIQRGFGISAPLVWTGLLSLLALIVLRLRSGTRHALASDPLVTIVLPPLAFLIAFSLIDFQGYDDAYPLLPYAALGLSGAAAAGISALQRRWMGLAWLAPAAVCLVLVIATWVWYAQPDAAERELPRQRRDAEVADALLGADGTLYALGNPAMLVLTGRTNPSPNIYLAAGVDQWVVEHTPGGFDGWVGSIEALNPDMIVIDGWITEFDYRDRMIDWLRSRYQRIRIGEQEVYVTSELRDAFTGRGAAIGTVGRQLGELLR